MNQSTLFSPHDTVYDALGADITAAGGFKVVAGKLWPSESITVSATKLRNAVSPNQPHKLCPEEILQIKRLAREAGSTATIDYEAQQLGYQITWVDPADQAEELRRQLVEGVATLNRMVGQLQKAEERAALKVVR